MADKFFYDDSFQTDDQEIQRQPAPPTHARRRIEPRFEHSQRSYAARRSPNAGRQNRRTAYGSSRRPNKRFIYTAGAAAALIAAVVVIIAVSGGKKPVDPAVPATQYPVSYVEQTTTVQPEATETTIDDLINATIAPGAQVLPLDQALTYWENTVEAQYANRIVKLSNGQMISAKEMGYSSDYRDVLTQTWAQTDNNALKANLTFMPNDKVAEVYNVSLEPYSELLIREYVESLAEDLYIAPVNASLKSFNPDKYRYDYNKSKEGQELDVEATVQSIMDAFDNGGGDVELIINPIIPEITTEAVSSQYGCLAYAETDASSSKAERISNIRLALSILNGTSVKAGYSFSFNATIGKRTTERGFQQAPAYENGTVSTQVGGGICQVSTTLFNAVVQADMDILERHNHSLTVHYVDPGLDATVNWNGADFRFRNTTEEKIYIAAMLTDDKHVRIGIFGRKNTSGETIRMISVKTGDIPYETIYKPTTKLSPGKKQVKTKGEKGLAVDTYKIRYDANKKEISRRKLFTSKYSGTNEVVMVGVEKKKKENG